MTPSLKHITLVNEREDYGFSLYRDLICNSMAKIDTELIPLFNHISRRTSKGLQAMALSAHLGSPLRQAQSLKPVAAPRPHLRHNPSGFPCPGHLHCPTPFLYYVHPLSSSQLVIVPPLSRRQSKGKPCRQIQDFPQWAGAERRLRLLLR